MAAAAQDAPAPDPAAPRRRRRRRPRGGARRPRLALPGVDWPRRARQLILLLLLGLGVSCAGLVFGAFADGRAIEADTGRAVAVVRSVSVLRTSVEFTDHEGEYRSPPTGVLFPVGLAEGQRVRVEFDRANPDRVRVAGRRWTLAVAPAASVFAAGAALAAGPWWWSVRASRRGAAGAAG